MFKKWTQTLLFINFLVSPNTQCYILGSCYVIGLLEFVMRMYLARHMFYECVFARVDCSLKYILIRSVELFRFSGDNTQD